MTIRAMSRKYAKAVVIACLLAGGCSSPDPAYYTLQMVPGVALPTAAQVVEVRRPGLAGYLDRADIVLKSADYQLSVNSQVRWGEPLGDMVGRVLTQDLSQRLSGASVFGAGGAISADADMRVEVDFQRFDEDAGGQVSLIAQLAVERGREHHPVATRHIVLTLRPASPGAANLVGAMSALLGMLADQVALDVQHAALPYLAGPN